MPCSAVSRVRVAPRKIWSFKRTPTVRWTLNFGPKAPAGKELNWVPTSADGKFEVLFRLDGPEKPLFEKTWKLPDIEKVTAQ